MTLQLPITDMKAIALRLNPRQDLKAELTRLVNEQDWTAACILTCAGSLSQVTMRFAGQPVGMCFKGYFEILSLTGTLSKEGCHLHVTVADKRGQTYGGHLLNDCHVYTTVELVIGILPHIQFHRHMDDATGFPELVVSPADSSTHT
ncbi:MAG: PPC domain-containing DNA-binding protein [Elainellaceae cyanobacterium]